MYHSVDFLNAAIGILSVVANTSKSCGSCKYYRYGSSKLENDY
jgi:hypothetical protein